MAMTWPAVMPVRRDQVVDGGRLIVEPAQQRPLRVGERELGGMTDRGLVGAGADLLHQGAELFEDVVDGLDQPGTVADQAVAAAAGQAVDRPGDGEDLAVLLHGVARGRKRPAARGRLDDEHAQAEPGDDPVPLGEEAGERTLPHRHLAHEGARLGDRPGQLFVLGRVDRRQAVGQDADACGRRP